MHELSSGTVTFLLTDVEGSTKLWERDAAAMREALLRHDALAAESVVRCGGTIVKSRGEGDSLFLVFDEASQAVAAALDLQRALHAEPWPERVPIRVRMALHTGEADLREADYYGPTVNRCARLRTIAHGSQTILSSSTRAVVHNSLPPGASLRDLGAHRLRDLQRPEQVFQLLHTDLHGEFPPLRSLDAFPNNLTYHLTSFVGREREMAEARRLLSASRLLTLTGTGGTGKTRLSQQLGADVLEEYADGVWFVELAPIADPALVPRAVASALGVSEQPERPLLDTLVEHLRARSLLLILDNCEHLVAACASLADQLLRSSPALRIVASSREALAVAGEQIYLLPALSLPDRSGTLSAETIVLAESVRLFVDRARLSKPSFVLTASNVDAVARICRRLDGLPLAIELAAARVKVMLVGEIAARLDDAFRLLTGGSRTALPHHQTLRALIDWSYEHLTALEQALFCRLSVFAGGFTLVAAEGVCTDMDVAPPTVLDLLSRLVEKSLVVCEEKDEEARYSLLETIRQYGREKLREQGEWERWGERHLDHFLKLAEEAEPHLLGSEQGAWLTRLEAEHDNLRAALDCSGSRQACAERGLRLAGALWRFWYVHGHLSEGRGRLEQALAREGAHTNTIARARALYGAGTLAIAQGDLGAARVHHEESLTISREIGDRLGVALSLGSLGFLTYLEGNFATANTLIEESLAISRELRDKFGVATSLRYLTRMAYASDAYSEARALSEESLAISRELGDRTGIAVSLRDLGIAAFIQGDHAEARRFYRESLDIHREIQSKPGIAHMLAHLGLLEHWEGDHAAAVPFYESSLAIHREIGNRWGIARALGSLGAAALDRNDYASARKFQEESLAIARELGLQQSVGQSLNNLGELAHATGEHAEAHRLYEESLAIRRDMGDKSGIGFSLLNFGRLALTEESPRRAARILAAGKHLLEELTWTLPAGERAQFDAAVGSARTALGEEAFAAETAAGQAMTLDEAVAYALTRDDP